METTYKPVVAPRWKASRQDWVDALRTPGFTAKGRQIATVFRHTRLGRAVDRYVINLGKVLAGGISYMAIFSLVAAVTVGWSLFSHFFAASPTFQSSVIDAANQLVPGLLDNDATGESGLIDPETLNLGKGSVLTGIVGFLVALWSASRIVRYSADGIRAMFGLMPFPGNFVIFYTRYFLGLLLLLVGVGVTAALSLAATWFQDALTEKLGLAHPLGDFLSSDVASLLVPLVVDTAVFYVFVRYVAAIKVPRKTLWTGAAVFAIASEVLRLAGTSVMHISSNPLFAAATTLATLLIWVNILARAALIVSAWMADPPPVASPITDNQIHFKHKPNYVTLAAPNTLGWPHHPLTGALIPADVVTVKHPPTDRG